MDCSVSVKAVWRSLTAALLLALSPSLAEARVVRLRIERREVVLNGRAFGAAGPYEKLVGKVDFGLDPALPAQRRSSST